MKCFVFVFWKLNMWFKLVWILKLQQMSTGSWKKTSAVIGDIYSLGVSIVTSVETFKQRGQEIFQGRTTFVQNKGRLILTFDHVTWKLKVVTFFLVASVVPCLATCQKILSGHYFTKTRSMTMWASTVQNLKSKDVDRTSLGLHRSTDRCKTICARFSKGA